MLSICQVAEKLGFVSGHRFSEAESLSKSDALLGAAAYRTPEGMS